MTTMQEFIQEHRIVATTRRSDSNPNMNDMPQGSRHWSIMLSRSDTNQRMLVKFSQGPAHMLTPTAEDVLDCLASDACGWENAPNFDVWCGEYGYDISSENAKRIFNAVRVQTKKLEEFLDPRQYNDLLWNMERL